MKLFIKNTPLKYKITCFTLSFETQVQFLKPIAGSILWARNSYCSLGARKLGPMCETCPLLASKLWVECRGQIH